MKKDSYRMVAMNRKQFILFESPITGKFLACTWYVESFKWVEWLFWTLWRTVCCDKEAEAHTDEMIRLGWLKVNEDA